VTVLIDADGCPVVDKAITLSKQAGIDCMIICDTAHVFEKPGATTVTVPKGSDSVDFKLVNMIKPGDIVITQDFGLAAMSLARGAFAINQNGMRYTDGNIDGLLLQRHNAKKIRMAGGRMKGPSKRTPEQDKAFEKTLKELLQSYDLVKPKARD
jgi:uncharacterized protein YaiI (UPF0178 family)